MRVLQVVGLGVLFALGAVLDLVLAVSVLSVARSARTMCVARR